MVSRAELLAAGGWGLRPDGGALWHVTVPRNRRTNAPVRLFRHRLTPDEVTTLDGIPITTVPRTLLDLSSLIPVHQLRRAVEQATALSYFDATIMRRILDRHRGRPGTPKLAALLEDFRAHGDTRTRSDMEALFLQLCLDNNLPRPSINRYNNGREIDATWPEHQLVVEIDSWKHHRSRVAFGRDRAKDRKALIAGRPTARYTADELEETPAAIAAELRMLLEATRIVP